LSAILALSIVIAIERDWDYDAVKIMMNEPDENFPKRNYKWPWFLLVAVLVFVVLAVVWVWVAAHREEQERDFNAQISTGAK